MFVTNVLYDCKITTKVNSFLFSNVFRYPQTAVWRGHDTAQWRLLTCSGENCGPGAASSSGGSARLMLQCEAATQVRSELRLAGENCQSENLDWIWSAVQVADICTL